MNFKNLKILLFVSILLFYGSFLVYKITLPAAQDLPRQIQNGQDVLAGNFDVLTKNVYSYTEPANSFANHHWFYGVMAYLLLSLTGWHGIVIFKVALILGTFLILWRILEKHSNFWFAAAAALPSIFLLISRTSFRPEIFSYFFLVLFLYILLNFKKDTSSNKILWLVPLQLVWVNTHLFFPVGIMLVVGLLMDSLIKHRFKLKGNLEIKKLSGLSLSLLLVSFINPFGLRGVIFSLFVNTNENFPIASAEIKTIPQILSSEPLISNVSAVAFMPCVALLLTSFMFAFLARHKKKQPILYENSMFLLLASLGSAGLSYYISRGMPLFGLIFFFTLGYNLYQAYLLYKERIDDFLSKKAEVLKTCIIALIILIAFLAYWGQEKIMYSSEMGTGLARHSLSAANFFIDNDLQGPIFNDTDIGSYLIGTLYPKEKVFSDNRFGDAYSEDFFADIYFPMIRDEEKWKQGADEYNFNAIVFYHYSAVNGVRDFIFRRIYDPGWVWVYADSYVVILVRNNERNKDIADKFAITPENFVQKFRFLEQAGDSLVVADLYNLVGRTDLSMPMYMKFVSKEPNAGKVWFVLGRTELTKSNQEESDPYLAALYIERALENGWATWEVYSYLALAYLRTGQLERVRWAVEKELALDPDNPDGHKWLGILADEEVKLKLLEEQ